MTIIPRGKKFGVSVKDPTHEKGQRWVGTYSTRERAEEEELLAKREVREAVAKQEDGTPRRDRITVNAYADRFLKVHCDGLQLPTVRMYAYELKRFQAIYGNRPLDSLSREDAVTWSTGAAKNTRRIVRMMFGKAVHDGLILSNVFLGIALKRGQGRSGNRLVVVTDAQLRTLAETARTSYGGDFGEQLAAMITVAACTAMRPGELFALEWANIDMDKGRINVKWSRRVDGVKKAPKNGQERIIACPPPAVAALRALTRTGPLVFTSKTGKQFSPSTFSSQWAPIRLASGVPIKDLYELRHYCATKLMEAGLMDWQVAAQMGHTDNGVLVRKTYFHPRPTDILDAIDGAWREAA